MGERTIGKDPGTVHEPIHLAIVDDHPAIAAAIDAAVRTTGSNGRPIEVVAVARTAAEARAIVALGRTRPDVLLCDVQLGDRADGLDVLDAAVRAGSRVIVLTAFDRSAFARAAFHHGAFGFLSKGLEVADILDAVRRVAAGGTAFSPASLDAIRSSPRPPSAREIAIVSGVSRGLTSQEIAFGLRISARTVESHVRRMFDRYGVVSRAELAVLAEREGWLSTPGR